jgi:hypothetical protein
MATMTTSPPVTIDAPDSQGGRLVRIHGTPVGRAYGLWDLIVFLHRAGMREGLADEDQIAASTLIDWRGGGPDRWDPMAR